MVLNEDRRQQLIADSRHSDKEADGRTRYDKRINSRVASSNASYNKIDMNQLFKDDILSVDIPIQGETDDYVVNIKVSGILEELQKMTTPEDELNFRIILRALIKCFNSNDVYLHCNCADFQYRFAYYLTLHGINSGESENRPSDKTNPDDTKGRGCKHVLLVLNNTNWAMKVASVIKNYITYVQKHYEKAYADIIYPALYGMQYEEPVQLSFEEPDESEIDAANKEARTRGRWTKETAPRWVKQETEGPLTTEVEETDL